MLGILKSFFTKQTQVVMTTYFSLTKCIVFETELTPTGGQVNTVHNNKHRCLFGDSGTASFVFLHSFEV